MSGAHLHSVGFLAADVGAAVAFHRLLGLAVPDGGPDAPMAVAPAGGPAGADLTLTWASPTALTALDPERAADPALRVQVEIGYDEPAGVDGAWRAATAAGHPGVVPPFDAPWGVRFAVLTDPDGNRVGVTAPLPTTSAPEA